MKSAKPAQPEEFTDEPQLAAGATVPESFQDEAPPTMTASQETAGQAVTNAATAFGTQAASTAMLGYDDEIMGLMSKLSGGSYTLARDKYAQGREAALEAFPTAGLVGQGVGVAATTLLPASAALRGGQMARTAIQGGLAGLGHSTADLTQGEYGQAAVDTAIGAGVGAAAGKLTQGISKTAGAAAQPSTERLTVPGAPAPTPPPGLGAALKGAGKLGGAVGIGAQMVGLGGPTAALAGGGLAALKAAGAVGQAALNKVVSAAAKGETTGPWVKEALDAGVPERIVRGIISYYGAQREPSQ